VFKPVTVYKFDITYIPNLPISMCKMSNRNRKNRTLSVQVYSLVSKIPKGSVATYGDIAKALGHPRSARAVGAILRKNPNPVVVPCHRVVLHNGKIGGYAFGIDAKKYLLKSEGLIFHNDTLQDLNLHKADFK
jgi:methylated-DNA-[protein]-cysteine S-methyltransferase